MTDLTTEGGTYRKLLDGLLPELHCRGLTQTESSPGTLRQKLCGTRDLLASHHPISQYCGAFQQSGQIGPGINVRKFSLSCIGPMPLPVVEMAIGVHNEGVEM